MISKNQIVTVLATLAVLYVIHNVEALKPVKKLLNFDQ